MKLWIKIPTVHPSKKFVITSVLTGFLFFLSGSDLLAQADTSRRFRSTEPVYTQKPTETTVVTDFETGNWHRIYIDSAWVRFQNAVSDTTVSIQDVERYLGTYLPGTDPKLAIHLSTSDYNSVFETVKLIADRWKTFSMQLVMPYPPRE